MSSTPNCDCWGFVIDTDSYAGNFERELCAHLTGQIGECEVGAEYIDESIIEIFSNSVIDVSDDKGCFRPCSIYPNPRYKNNGMGFAYVDGQEDIALEKLKQSYLNQADHCLRVYADKTYGQKEKDRWTKMANDLKEVTAYPCYNSVIIYFENEPTDEQINIMKKRTTTFQPKEFVGSFKVEGFRVVQFVRTTKTKYV